MSCACAELDCPTSPKPKFLSLALFCDLLPLPPLQDGPGDRGGFGDRGDRFGDRDRGGKGTLDKSWARSTSACSTMCLAVSSPGRGDGEPSRADAGDWRSGGGRQATWGSCCILSGLKQSRLRQDGPRDRDRDGGGGGFRRENRDDHTQAPSLVAAPTDPPGLKPQICADVRTVQYLARCPDCTSSTTDRTFQRTLNM